MSYLNKVQIIGHLGDAPSLNHTQSGKPVANFSVATTLKGTKGQPDITEWHRVTVWDNLALNAQKYLFKGSLVYVEGRLQTREYTTKTGEKAKSTEIIAINVQFLSTKGNTENPKPVDNEFPKKQYEAPQPSNEDYNYDSIPF